MEINDQQDAYSEARKQVRREARLYGNILMCCAFWGFAGLNDIFDFVNIPRWIVIVFIIITIFTALKFIKVIFSGMIFNKSWEENRIRELMKKNN
ncbi:2TM domain-containing protein [Elizabethkingia miricola]|uniref:2TM domain-containing protein n=1 Tax=Elizabethkingia miricola TaxID=172045 RepID=UPI000999D909|nr:2TM domain-containing protein [Elizabethkingia miricola]OPC08166.1 hypothetical protein BAY01_17440 [Elizabethkingia miricola]